MSETLATLRLRLEAREARLRELGSDNLVQPDADLLRDALAEIAAQQLEIAAISVIRDNLRVAAESSNHELAEAERRRAVLDARLSDEVLARLEQEMRGHTVVPWPVIHKSILHRWADTLRALRAGDEAPAPVSIAAAPQATSTVDDWLTCTACQTVIDGADWTGACPQCGNGTMREGRHGAGEGRQGHE